jgi:hypothetical protein
MSAEEDFKSKVDQIQEDLSDMKSSMGKIAEAVTRLAVLEEKHHGTVLALERILVRVERDEERINSVEKVQIRQDAAIGAYMKAVQGAWAVLGAGVLYVGAQIVTFVTHGAQH